MNIEQVRCFFWGVESIKFLRGKSPRLDVPLDGSGWINGCYLVVATQRFLEFSSLPQWRNDSIWRSYFSVDLKPSPRLGSVGYNPNIPPFLSRWDNPLILTIDPNFRPIGHPSNHLIITWDGFSWEGARFFPENGRPYVAGIIKGQWWFIEDFLVTWDEFATWIL